MKTIWIVHGSTGEYSDRGEWNVVAVKTKELAEEWIKALDIQYQSIPQHMKDSRWDYEDEMKKIMSLDPSFSMDYTGTSYFYGEVRLAEGSPPITNGEQHDVG